MNLPYEVLYTIYKYKHQLEYVNVMDELKKMQLNVFLNIDLNLANMLYLNHEIFLVKCVNVNNLNITSTQILNIYLK